MGVSTKIVYEVFSDGDVYVVVETELQASDSSLLPSYSSGSSRLVWTNKTDVECELLTNCVNTHVKLGGKVANCVVELGSCYRDTGDARFVEKVIKVLRRHDGELVFQQSTDGNTLEVVGEFKIYH